jgi:hypothetical protein
MKKIIVGMIFAMAAVAFVASPAAADIKFTSKGYMQVQGLYLNGYPVKMDGHDGSNNWYNMEMVIQPTLHINDKVRIHAQIRMMERNFSGTGAGSAGDAYITNANEDKYNVWGDSQNNFWLERLYMSFPLFGGTLSVGRMSGGNWAHPFMDSDQNRDRIKYVRRVGPFTLLGVLEKLDERDGGLEAPRFYSQEPAGTTSYSRVDHDRDALALGAVLPFSKNIILRPLYYGIRDGDGITGTEPDLVNLLLFGGIYKFGPVKFEHDVTYRWVDVKGDSGLGNNIDDKYDGWNAWAGFDIYLGPLTVALNGFWIKGGTADMNSKSGNYVSGTGNRFQPLLLLFSEDMGLLYNTNGVPNGSVDRLSSSGYRCIYLPVDFKISDDMKVGAVLGYLEADKMLKGTHWNGGAASKKLGWEVDVSFEWRFLDNVKYVFNGGVYMPGDYLEEYAYKDAVGNPVVGGVDTRNVYGIRNTIRVEW